MPENIAEPLLKWYDKNKRILPWRDKDNAYYTWVSEIMLQQTRVEAVKPYFHGLSRNFPMWKPLQQRRKSGSSSCGKALVITAVFAICRKRPFRSWKNMMAGFLKTLRHFSR